MNSFDKNKRMDISRAILSKKPCVLVLFPPKEDAVSLLTQLKRIGCSVENCWPHPLVIESHIDLIFLYMSPEVEQMDYCWLHESGPPIITVSNTENPTLIDEALRIGAMSILISPIKASGLLSTIITTLYQYAKNSRTSSRVTQLEMKIANLKVLEEAKRIIMEKKDINENDAYEIIRSQAMSERVPIDKISKDIIRSERLMSKVIGINSSKII